MYQVGPPASRISRVGCTAASKLLVPYSLKSVTITSNAAGTAADRTSLPGMPFVMYQSMAFGSSGAAPCPDKTLTSFLAAS